MEAVYGLFRFVNFGYDHYEELNGEDGLRLEVFTDLVGKLFSNTKSC